MFVLDSHCDTPSQIHRLRDMSQDDAHSHVDYPKLRRSVLDAAFFALYVPAAMKEEEAYSYARILLSELKESVSGVSDFVFADSVEEAVDNKSKGLFSIFIGLENGSPIGKDLSLLEEFRREGVRYMTLCHSADNEICDSCASGTRWHGLSPFGREVIRKMNEIGMLVDVSHASDDTFYDVLRFSAVPVVATHSCCRALSAHPRNMTDDMICALADKGGVIQINFYPLFLDMSFSRILAESGLEERGDSIEAEFIAAPSDPLKRQAWYEILDALSALERPSYTLIADHVEHVVRLVGVDHVGLGSDFDGICVTPSGMEDVTCFGAVLDELRRRGYPEEAIAKIAGGNFLRVMKAAEDYSNACAASVGE